MTTILETAIAAARLGGKILMESLNDLESKQVQRKQEFDFVTQIDHQSEEAILKLIRERHPGHSVLAEESGGSKEEQDYLWIIDPLDGTKNYIHGFPFFAISIALQFENELRVGVVFDPVRDELFHAQKGKGAFLNDDPIKVAAVLRNARNGCWVRSAVAEPVAFEDSVTLNGKDFPLD